MLENRINATFDSLSKENRRRPGPITFARLHEKMAGLFGHWQKRGSKRNVEQLKRYFHNKKTDTEDRSGKVYTKVKGFLLLRSVTFLKT